MLIKCQNLSLGYDGRAIIENLNFQLCKGDYLCIIGENGSGKSTLMKTLLQLNRPISGEIITAPTLSANNIGYLPQQTVVQKDFPASVYEIVISGCLPSLEAFPFYSKKHKMLAKTNMERLGITDLSKRCFRELSGGQQQRVLLARALCAAKELILLDEPASGLDPKVTAELYDIVCELNNEGMSVIMISHDVSAAIKYASHILHIGAKEIFFGTKDEYTESDIGKQYLEKHCGLEHCLSHKHRHITLKAKKAEDNI